MLLQTNLGVKALGTTPVKVAGGVAGQQGLAVDIGKTQFQLGWWVHAGGYQWLELWGWQRHEDGRGWWFHAVGGVRWAPRVHKGWWGHVDLQLRCRRRWIHCQWDDREHDWGVDRHVRLACQLEVTCSVEHVKA